MTDHAPDPKEAATETIPDGVLVHLGADGEPIVSIVGEGLPKYAAPTLLRVAARRLEGSLSG